MIRYRLSVVTLLLCVASALSFTPPTDLTPYEPANNVATVTHVRSTATLDVYVCNEDGAAFAVHKGTAAAAVLREASLTLAWEALTDYDPGIDVDYVDRQAATLWWSAEVVPLYK